MGNSLVQRISTLRRIWDRGRCNTGQLEIAGRSDYRPAFGP